jgi:uncharacterized membrane protein
MAPPAGSDPAAGGPPPEPVHWTEHEVEVLLGRLLQWGVGIAATVVLVGATLYLAHHGGEPPAYGTFVGEPADLRHIVGIVRSAADLSGRGLIQLGLLLLIGTPIARVALSLLVFVRDRDGLYVKLTAFVLLILLLGLSGVAP